VKEWVTGLLSWRKTKNKKWAQYIFMCARISLCCRPPLFYVLDVDPPRHTLSPSYMRISPWTHTRTTIPIFLLLLGGRVLYNKRNINNDLFFFLSFGALLFFIWFYLSADEREREIMGVVGTVTRTHLDTTPIWSAAVVKTISAGVVPIISRQSHLINYRTVRLPITHLLPVPALIVDQF
jgi:hypothetical protein